jgi:hypothetical protein
MALVSLMLQNVGVKGQFRTLIDTILVDATMSDAATYGSEPTSHPVESGSEISDHAILKPIELKIEGFISETPLSLNAQKAGLIAAVGSSALQQIGGFKGGLATTLSTLVAGKAGAALFSETENPLDEARKKLVELVNSKKLITIATKYQVYTNMMLYSLTINRDNSTGRALRFNATFREIKIVSADSVIIELLNPDIAHSGAPKQKLGKKPGQPANAEQTAKSSILFKAGSALGFGGG